MVVRLLFHRKVLPTRTAFRTRCPARRPASSRKAPNRPFHADSEPRVREGSVRQGAALPVALALALLLTIAPKKAFADEPRPLAHDLRLDIPITVVAAGTALGLNLAAGSLAPSCRWCGSNGLDDAVRSALRRNDPEPARFASDVFVVASPFVNVGLLALAANDEGRPEEIPLNSLLVAESASIAMLLNAVAKVSFARERPAVHALAESDKPKTDNPADNNVSFFSGHAAFTFALATSAGTIAQMRGYRIAPALWGVGLPIAFATSYLRVAADRHYFTDVLGGMVLSLIHI